MDFLKMYIFAWLRISIMVTSLANFGLIRNKQANKTPQNN